MEAAQVLGGRYRLEERLGTGGMSVVWRAHDDVLGRSVAVKVLAPELIADRESRAMIRAEAQAVASLSHPHVTGVYDYGESTNHEGAALPYVVMELVSGPTLEQRLAHGPLPWRTALRIGAEIAAALAAAHARGLVHRDVKPANVLLTPAGAKVVDFGLAAVAGATGELGSNGTLLGTPAYVAPERLAGGPVRPATDVYALGVLLYRALSGRLPWPAESTTQMIEAHVYAQPKPMPAVHGLPEGVGELCARCLAKDPADRPSSREIAARLAAAAGVAVPLPADRFEEDLVAAPLVQAEPSVGHRRGPWRRTPAPPDPEAATALLANSVVDRSPGRGRRRRAVQLGGVAVGLVAAGLAVTTCAEPRSRTGQVATGPSGPAGGVIPAPCAVRYVTRSDTAGRFDVEVTVTNNSTRPVPEAAALQFTFAGDQALRGSSAGEWTQSGAGVVTARNLAGGAPLAPRASTTAGFFAEYRTANPLPTGFTLGGLACSYVVVGASGGVQTGGPQPGPSRLAGDSPEDPAPVADGSAAAGGAPAGGGTMPAAATTDGGTGAGGTGAGGGTPGGAPTPTSTRRSQGGTTKPTPTKQPKPKPTQPKPTATSPEPSNP